MYLKNLTSTDILISSIGVSILGDETRSLDGIGSKYQIKNSEIPTLVQSGVLQVLDQDLNIVNDQAEYTEEFRVSRKPVIPFVGTDKLPNIHNSLIPYTNVGQLYTSRAEAGVTYAIPFYLSKSFQINELGIMFTDKKAANYRLSIAKGDTKPETLIVDTGLKSATSSGLFQHTVNLLTTDQYYWLLLTLDTSKQLRFVNSENVISIIGLCGCEKHVTHLESAAVDYNNLVASNWEYHSDSVPALFLYGEYL